MLETLTRCALGVRAMHGSAQDYTRQVARLAMEGVNVGEKYHQGQHFKDVEFLAAKVLQAHDATVTRRCLPGLGIPSDFSILMDGIPLGGIKAHGRHGSVTVICLNLVSTVTHRLYSQLVSWCTPAAGHGGLEMASAVLQALAGEPWGLDGRELRARLSLVGGDGAAARGGSGRKKPGTRCAEHMWAHVHPLPQGGQVPLNQINMDQSGRIDELVADAGTLHFCTEWDKYHREDIALHRAIKRSGSAEELYAVAAAMDHMFHMGDGRLLLKRAASAVGTETRSGWLPAPTRKAVGLASEPGNVIANFTAYAAGLHARREWRRDGHGSTSLSELVDMGRRLVAVDFVVFALAFRDVMRFAVAPWSLAIQSASFEPWVLQRKKHAHDARLEQSASALRWSRQLLRVLILLRQHAPDEDTRALARACIFARPTDLFPCSARDDAHAARPWGKTIPAFIFSLSRGLLSSTPMFQRVELQAAVRPDRMDKMCLGPHCQCHTLNSPSPESQNPLLAVKDGVPSPSSLFLM